MDRGDIRDPNRSRRVAGRPGGVGNIVLIENQQHAANALTELDPRSGLQFLSHRVCGVIPGLAAAG